MKLTNADRAVVDIAKLRDYCLNLGHFRGQHKARVFASALGFTSIDAENLRDLLLTAVRSVDALPAEHDQFGERFIIDFEVQRNDKEATIRSIWIIRVNEDFPRFVSCYVL